MKKRWILAVAGVAAAAGVAVLLRPADKTACVQTQQLKTQRVEQMVTCSGVLEAGGRESVYAGAGCVIGEVLVEEGQAVCAGDALLRVDKTATRGMQSSDRTQAALALAAMPDIVTAPADGIVLKVNAKPGEWLAVQAPCAVLATREDMRVRVRIREKDLPTLRTGLAASVSGDGLGEERYTGVLTEISPAARTTTGGAAVVEGVVTLDAGQSSETLRPGLTAKARIVTAVTEQGVLVPYAAVQEDAHGRYVYVLRNGRACRAALEPVAELADGVLTEDVALSGCTVILEPERVQEGAAVTAQEGAAT